MKRDSPRRAPPSFLRGQSPVGSSVERWGGGRIVLELCSYLSETVPPAELVTSVRGVVLTAGRVVVLRNRDGMHYLPGGRREPGESYLETLAREVREECGLALTEAEYLGFIHFRHLSPKPADYPYPYPDMYHLVYSVQSEGRVRSEDPDGYEEQAKLVMPPEAEQIDGMEFALGFLKRAVGR